MPEPFVDIEDLAQKILMNGRRVTPNDLIPHRARMATDINDLEVAVLGEYDFSWYPDEVLVVKCFSDGYELSWRGYSTLICLERKRQD